MQEREDSGNDEQVSRHQFYTLIEASKILRVSVRTMRQLLLNGEVRGRKLGGQWRIAHSELFRVGTGDDALSPEQKRPMTDDDVDPPDAPYGDIE